MGFILKALEFVRHGVMKTVGKLTTWTALTMYVLSHWKWPKKLAKSLYDYNYSNYHIKYFGMMQKFSNDHLSENGLYMGVKFARLKPEKNWNYIFDNFTASLSSHSKNKMLN